MRIVNTIRTTVFFLVCSAALLACDPGKSAYDIDFDLGFELGDPYATSTVVASGTVQGEAIPESGPFEALLVQSTDGETDALAVMFRDQSGISRGIGVRLKGDFRMTGAERSFPGPFSVTCDVAEGACPVSIIPPGGSLDGSVIVTTHASLEIERPTPTTARVHIHARASDGDDVTVVFDAPMSEEGRFLRR